MINKHKDKFSNFKRSWLRSSVSSNEKINQIHHVFIILNSPSISLGSSLSTCRSHLLLKNRVVSRPCNNGSKLLESRPRVRVGVLAMLGQRVMIEAIIQLHLSPMIYRLLFSQMMHVCVHLELPPLQVGWDGLQGWRLMWRWWWSMCCWLMLLIFLWLLYLPWHAIFFNKWPVNRRSDMFCWCDWYSIELAKTYN